MLIQIFAAFAATLFFSILFNCDKKELLYCGLSGALGWSFYLIVLHFSKSVIVATFVAAFGVSVFSNFLAIKRKSPVTIYQIPGLIPIVPGATIYKTLFSTINDLPLQALDNLIKTLQIGGAIALALLLVTSSKQLIARLKANSQ